MTAHSLRHRHGAAEPRFRHLDRCAAGHRRPRSAAGAVASSPRRRGRPAGNAGITSGTATPPR